MRKVLIFLLIAGLLLLGTCAISAEEPINITEITLSNPFSNPIQPCGGGGGAGEGGAPG